MTTSVSHLEVDRKMIATAGFYLVEVNYRSFQLQIPNTSGSKKAIENQGNRSEGPSAKRKEFEISD